MYFVIIVVAPTSSPQGPGPSPVSVLVSDPAQQGPELHDGHLQGLGIGCASAAMPSFQIAAGQPIFPIPDPMPFVAGLLLCHPFAV